MIEYASLERAIFAVAGAAAGVALVVAARPREPEEPHAAADPLRVAALTAAGVLAILPLCGIASSIERPITPAMAPPGVTTTTVWSPIGLFPCLVVLLGEAFMPLVEVAVAFAGKGRPVAVVGRVDPWLRGLFIGGSLAIMVVTTALDADGLNAGSQGEAWSAAALLAIEGALLVLAPRLVARAGGESVLVPVGLGLVAGGLGPIALEYARIRAGGADMVIFGETLLTPVTPALIAIFAVRRYRLGRRALARLGVRVITPADLALAAIGALAFVYFVVGTATLFGSPSGRSTIETLVKDAHALLWAPLVVAGALALALRALRRYLDEADARARVKQFTDR